MDYGLDGQMMVAVEPEQLLQEESDTPKGVEISPIHMLELELETLAIELDEEKEKLRTQRADCKTHMQQLQDAELALLQCRDALQQSEKKFQDALVEINNKQDRSSSLQEQLQYSKQLVSEAELQRETAKREAKLKDTSVESTVSELAGELEARTVELGRCQERYELLENEFSDHKALVIHQMNALEEEHEQQQSRLLDQIKTLEKQTISSSRAGQRTSREAVEPKQVDELKRYVRGVKHQEAQQRDEMKKLEEQLDIRESRIAALSHEVEALQNKARRIPALAGKLTRLEATHKAAKEEFESEKRRITRTFTDLQSQNKILVADVEKAKQASASIEKERKKATKRVTELETEKARLESLVAELEQVRAQRALIGIMFCVDISGSLAGAPEQLAKDAFRKLVGKIRAKYSNAHVGVVVHASSVSTVRRISPLDTSVDCALDSTWCGGSENYYTAVSLVQTELMHFRTTFPKANSRAIMISDGEDIGTPGNIATLATWGVLCHNVVIEKITGYNSQETAKYAVATGGTTVQYNGTNSNMFDALIA